MAVALPFLLFSLSSCREQAPTAIQSAPTNLQFRLPLDSYYSFDNMELDYYGFPVPLSEFRNSWTILDTSAVSLGYQGVTVAVDSIFRTDTRGSDSLARTEYRYFRTVAGDVFEYGFIARLLEQRDSILISPQWDKLFSSSAGANALWTVESNDSLPDGVYGSFYSSRELIGTTVNNVPTGVLAYHVEITGQALDIHLWISDAPSCILLVEDDSDVEVNRMYQRLILLRTVQ